MKTDGIASAAYALRYWERRQDVASNNLANVNTTGFKGERVFARLVAEGLPVAEASTDFTEGVFSPTGNPLDIAQRGNNYFVVSTPGGERWTHGGSWSVDPKGFLADADGNQLLGEKGPIAVAGKTVEIDRTGWVVVDRVRVDRLRVETPAAGAVLQHEGGTRFVPDAGRTVVAVDARDIRQGHLEGSNVEIVQEMVDMITSMRAYEINSKAIKNAEEMMSTANNMIR